MIVMGIVRAVCQQHHERFGSFFSDGVSVHHYLGQTLIFQHASTDRDTCRGVDRVMGDQQNLQAIEARVTEFAFIHATSLTQYPTVVTFRV